MLQRKNTGDLYQVYKVVNTNVVVVTVQTQVTCNRYTRLLTLMLLMLQRKDTGDLHQVWYDDPQSLRIKYKLADNTSLRGVGMWQADTLNYSDTPEGRQERTDMWGALPDRK